MHASNVSSPMTINLLTNLTDDDWEFLSNLCNRLGLTLQRVTSDGGSPPKVYVTYAGDLEKQRKVFASYARLPITNPVDAKKASSSSDNESDIVYDEFQTDFDEWK